MLCSDRLSGVLIHLRVGCVSVNKKKKKKKKKEKKAFMCYITRPGLQLVAILVPS
jgi:hypothetical protein